MDDVEWKGRVLAIEMLLVDLFTSTEAEARRRADDHLRQLPDWLGAPDLSAEDRAVFQAALPALRAFWDKAITMSRFADQSRNGGRRRD